MCSLISSDVFNKYLYTQYASYETFLKNIINGDYDFSRGNEIMQHVCSIRNFVGKTVLYRSFLDVANI